MKPSTWMMCGWVAALGLLLSATTAAKARGLLVPSDYITIQAAVDAAVDGDSILVSAGEYAELVVVQEKDISLIGEGVESTIVRPPLYTAFSFKNVESATLRGFRLEGGSAGVVISVRSMGVVVEDVDIHETTMFGVKVEPNCQLTMRRVKIRDLADDSWGIALASTYATTIEDILIDGGSTGVWMGDDDVLFPLAMNNVTIKNERRAGVETDEWVFYDAEVEVSNFIITENQGPGILIKSPYGYPGVHLEMTGFKIFNNAGGGIVVEGENNVTLNDSELHDNGMYDVEVKSHRDGRTLNFQRNDWGPVTTAEMNNSDGNITSIWDYYDDPSVDIVDYSNWKNPVGVDGQTPSVLNPMFALLPNFPNPFNPRTTLRFSLPSATTANLSIYDLAGRKVETLVDGPLSAGEHAVPWAPEHAPSGVYISRLETPAATSSRQLLLTK